MGSPRGHGGRASHARRWLEVAVRRGSGDSLARLGHRSVQSCCIKGRAVLGLALDERMNSKEMRRRNDA